MPKKTTKSLEQFKINDFVWAKLLGHPPWPGIVMIPDPRAPRKLHAENMQWIYFFGTHNYAWIENGSLKSYEAFKHYYTNMYKRNNFKRAVNEVEEIIEQIRHNPQYKINFIKYISKSNKINIKPRKPSSPFLPTVKRLIEEIPTMPASPKRQKSSLSNDDEEIRKFILSDKAQNRIASPMKRPVRIIEPSEKIFGILAGNIYATGIIQNLLETGHRLNVWCANDEIKTELNEILADSEGGQQMEMNGRCAIKLSPKELVIDSEIIISCQDNAEKSRYLILQLGESLTNKKYIEMSSMGPEISMELLTLIEGKNGTYLEAMIDGGRHNVFNKSSTIFTSGSQELYNECESYFKSICKFSYFLSKTDAATTTHSIFKMMEGVFVTGLSECLALADKCGLSKEVFRKMFTETTLANKYFIEKIDAVIDNRFTETDEPVEKLQTAMSRGLDVSQKFKQEMPLTAYANESLKQSRRMGYDGKDSVCMFIPSRF